MGEREEERCCDGCGCSGGEQAQEAQEEEVLQEELLQAGPDGVAPVTLDELGGGAGRVQGVEGGGGCDGCGGEGECGGDDPEGTQRGGDAQAHGA